MKTFAMALCVALTAAQLHAGAENIQPPAQPRYRLVWGTVHVAVIRSIARRETRHHVTLNGELRFDDLTGIAGSGQTIITRIEAPDGEVIYSSEPPDPSNHSFHDGFLRSFGQTPLEVKASVSATLPLEDRYFKSLKRIVGYVELLKSPKGRRLDLPLVPQDEAMALDESTNIRIVEAAQKGQELRVQVLLTGSGGGSVLLKQHFMSPQAGLVARRIVLVDESGNDSAALRPSNSIKRMDEQMEQLMTIVVNVPQGVVYKNLRFDLTESGTEPVHFELTDLQLPQITAE